jgi:regulator of RNase E activity RraA
MPEIPIDELCDRYRRIQPLTLEMKVAGPAFTMLGRPERSTDRTIRKGAKAIDGLRPHNVAVMDCSGEEITGHWVHYKRF